MRHIQSNWTKYQFAIEKKLFVYDSGQREGNMDVTFTHLHSGIRATIFGASGYLGKPIAALLGMVNSSLTMPINLDHHFRHSEHIKELRLCGPTNKTWVDFSLNFKNDQLIQNYIKNSNVVINLVGPRHKLKKREDFEFINIEVAQKIAKACTKYGVHRLIHFSAAGADPLSPSLDFQTKYEAEAVVKQAFPNVTIFRPCPVYGMNDNFSEIIKSQLNFFWNKFVLVYDDCQAKKQPIRDRDIAMCVLNALKLQQSKGKTYQLGGPHILSMLEVHEIIFNIMKLRPTIAYVQPQLALALTKHIYNWPYFSTQLIKKRKIDEVVKSDKYYTISDLLVQPVSFKSGVYEVLKDWIAYYRQIEEDYDN